MRRVLGVAGWQGAGKTTLLERVVSALASDGLSVAVVEHDVHGVDLDVAGKDSDRLFRAGASEVVVDAPGERFVRVRPHDEGSLEARLRELELRHDLVLVEGYKATPHPKVWLLRRGESAPPAEAAAVVASLPWDGDRETQFLALLRGQLAEAWQSAPRRTGVLLGGASRRMGSPKHALVVDGRTLLARTVEVLATGGLVALLGSPPGSAPAPGAADLGPSAVGPGREGTDDAPTDLVRLVDVPGVQGPLAGVLAALRWDPVCWLVAPCDLPRLRPVAVEWLLAQRRPGCWAVLPRVEGVVQPLLAVFEPQALPLLEGLAAEGAPGPSRLAGHPHVATPEPPAEIAECWRGVNTPEELAALGLAGSADGFR